jgi:ATP-dependent Clp protease ATP-binding subunit ClpC
VFERFTDEARQVVVLAQDEARGLRHNYIGTEHLLLGLLREDGVAAAVLRGLNVSVDDVRGEVATIVGQGGDVTAGQIPFTPRAKKVLELGLREALSLGHNYIGSEHILLGVVREDDGVAARILHDSGLNSEMIRNEVIRKVGTHRESSWQLQSAPSVRRGQLPRRQSSYAPIGRDLRVLLAGWVLFAIALGIGIAIGWAIWG